MQYLILVAGATGYIASRLIPQLLERGYRIRALARHPERLKFRNWYPQVEIVRGDVTDSSTLTSALEGVHTAYYLIHNMSSGHGYTSLEVEGARNFAQAAEIAGVQHIIYLGGLADPEQHIAPHMRSRIETGATLRVGKVPVTEFRAGVVAGSGSISFEMIRFMTELFPIIPGPKWLKNKSQPISTQNVVDYLLAALDNWDGHGQVFEIGGPDIATYQELMLKYANAAGHKRAFLLLPYVPVWFMAFGIGLTTPVSRNIAYALVAGLSSDSIALHNDALAVYPGVKLVDFESATREALKRLHPLMIERVWDDGQSGVMVLKHEGFFIDHREIQTNASVEKTWDVIKNLGANEDWLFANWLWKLRGWLDGRAGQAYYEIDSIEPNQRILLRSKLSSPGEGWMEWRLNQNGGMTTIKQTAYFAPRGPGGFLYWYLLYPFHVYVFRGLIKAIARRSVVE